MVDPQAALKAYYADPMLANGADHEVLADVLVSYLQAQVCAVWSGATGHVFDALPPGAADAVNIRQPPARAADAARGRGRARARRARALRVSAHGRLR